MRPENLQERAAEHLRSTRRENLVIPGEREEDQLARFRQRVDGLLESAEIYAQSGQRAGCQFDKKSTVRHLPDGGVARITTRALFIGFTPEDGIQELAEDEVDGEIVIGVHDVEFMQPDGSWWMRGKVESCDVVTTLDAYAIGPEYYEVSDEEREEYTNVFEGFQVLERMNWEHPVFPDDPTESTNDPPLFGVYIKDTAKAQAVTDRAKGFSTLLEGMTAALDEADIVLSAMNSYKQMRQA